MRHYELVVILSPMLNQEQAADTWGRIKGFINNRQGEIDHEETWGTRRLAYPIRKGGYRFLEGTYHLTRFSTESPFNRELETFLHQDDQVLRSLVVVAEAPKPIPAPAPAQETAVAEAASASAVAGEPVEVREPQEAQAVAQAEGPVAETRPETPAGETALAGGAPAEDAGESPTPAVAAGEAVETEEREASKA